MLLLLLLALFQGRVVSGHSDALDVVSASAAALGALKVARLAVSGAFHTRLMAPARAALMEVSYCNINCVV
jgi:[acyl-carrier-protein] S-malonyltransferase